MMDSGIRSGPDIARVMSSGADFSFLGRSFMYGVGALGDQGGDHTIAMLKMQLQQVLEQVCCEKVTDLPKYLVKEKWDRRETRESWFWKQEIRNRNQDDLKMCQFENE